MCGRYSFFTDNENAEIMQIVREINTRYPESNMKTGEVYPTNLAPILKNEKGELHADLAVWGFPNFARKGVVINARSETAADKKMFRDSLLRRRCVIPSTGFYEWSQDKEHQKYRFLIPKADVLYMAGFYNDFQGERRYVILTTAGNESIRDIHHRMPVILTPEQLQTWSGEDTDAALNLTHSPLPMLSRSPAF